jgi:hypothetical protein
MEMSRKQYGKKDTPLDLPNFLKPEKVGKSADPTEYNTEQSLQNNNAFENNTSEYALFGQQDDNFSNLENMSNDTSKYDDTKSVSDRLAELEQRARHARY